MSEDTISVRIGSDKAAALDAIAARTHRDLSSLSEDPKCGKTRAATH
jgi:hypothetical protein